MAQFGHDCFDLRIPRAIDSALTQCILRGGAGLGVLRSDLRINSHLGFFENSYELGD